MTAFDNHLEHMCRVCLGISDRMHSLFDKTNDLADTNSQETLADKFNECSRLPAVSKEKQSPYYKKNAIWFLLRFTKMTVSRNASARHAPCFSKTLFISVNCAHNRTPICDRWASSRCCSSRRMVCRMKTNRMGTYIQVGMRRNYQRTRKTLGILFNNLK